MLKAGIRILTGSLAILAFSIHTHAGDLAPASYGWAENAGWINLQPSHHGITITAEGLSGFAWAENIGWIRFGSDQDPPYENTGRGNWGVNRDAFDNLSGFAWAENIGWINFDPLHGGVVFDPAAQTMHGYAWSENVGWIYLQNYDVIFSDSFENP